MPQATHILPSQNDYLETIFAAAEDDTDLDWTCPKSARPGDRVFFYITSDGLIAFGTVDALPEPSENWNRRYAAQITNVHLLDTFLALATLREEMPEFGWARYPRSYVTLSPAESSQIDTLIESADSLYSEFESDSGSYVEGAVKLVHANAYERSLAARNAAIRHHGSICAICSFDFEKHFGPAMRGFIHMHHIKPLNEIDEEYRVDPKTDLIPVCPNCHAVIHSRRKALSVDEVRAIRRTA
jgi:hypothetical protein